jgi:hypothetical protein
MPQRFPVTARVVKGRPGHQTGRGTNVKEKQMARLCAALIATGMLLPSLLAPPAADGFWCPPPALGSALGVQ